LACYKKKAMSNHRKRVSPGSDKVSAPSRAALSALLWEKLFRETSESLGLQGRIRQMLVAAITQGHLTPDAPVPSSRFLSDTLKVARNTVVFAYQELVSEGYLVTRNRSGHFVGQAAQQRNMLDIIASAGGDDETDFWHGRIHARPSQQRNIRKPANWQTQPYPFVYGQFDPALFPTSEWRECCMKALSIVDIRSWAQDLIMMDDPEIIAAIQNQVLPRRGFSATKDEIMVTVGAQHALYLLADLLVRPGNKVGMEEPGYPDARNIFSSRTRHVVPVPVNEEGVDVEGITADMDMIFVTPSHQCPTGVTMSMARRQALLEKANACNTVIVEDDFEFENSFIDKPFPALKSLDQNGRVIYVGSLSKTFAPGLRLGFIVGPKPLVDELRALKRLMLRHAPSFLQRAFALFVSLGHYQSFLRKQSQIYGQRERVLRDALKEYLPTFQIISSPGGSFCWVRAPEHIDTTALTAVALQNGIVLEPGEVFFSRVSKSARRYIRFGYGSIDEPKIAVGIKTLAELVAQHFPVVSRKR